MYIDNKEAIILGITIASLGKGLLKNKIITFQDPPMVTTLEGKGLIDKYKNMSKLSWINIMNEACINKILEIIKNLKIVKKIIIITDNNLKIPEIDFDIVYWKIQKNINIISKNGKNINIIGNNSYIINSILYDSYENIVTNILSSKKYDL
jgi:hypothetical protein